jgi:GAF domain-containing protein
MSKTAATEPFRETKIVQAFLELADTLVADFDIIDSLTALTLRCVELLDTTATGILLADATGQLRLVAASSDQARLLELFQIQNAEGPCLEAFASGHPVMDNDLHNAVERWPQFSLRAVEAGYGSVYAIPLRLRGEIIGALNLFRADSGELSDTDIDLAQALADLASIAILQAQAATDANQRSQQLQHALDSRVVIEQAKGMLAEFAHIDMTTAFESIRAHSRKTNTKLTELATDIVSRKLDLNLLTTGTK